MLHQINLLATYQLTDADMYKLSFLEEKKYTAGNEEKRRLHAITFGVLKAYRIRPNDIAPLLEMIRNEAFCKRKDMLERFGQLNSSFFQRNERVSSSSNL
jgi:hypothetical protein